MRFDGEELNSLDDRSFEVDKTGDGSLLSKDSSMSRLTRLERLLDTSSEELVGDCGLGGLTEVESTLISRDASSDQESLLAGLFTYPLSLL